MTANIFSDTDVCMACEKPLKSSDALYCDDICRARDGQSNKPASGLQPGVSPSIFASLPGLLSSRARQSHGPTTGFGSSGHQSTTHTSDSTASSQSATSSPLQSPSPFAPPCQAGVSPQEDTFHLPPPAYPNAPIGFSPGLPASSHPVKIPSSLRGLPAAVPSPQRATLDLGHSGAQVGTDATLHYGRRPGVTNSITSPLALFPIGGSYSRRRESNDKLVRPVPNALGLSPSKQGWSLHGTGPAAVSIYNGRIVSDSSAGPHAHGVGKQTPVFSNYGAHSPLITAANRRPVSTSALDASEAQGSLTSTTSTVETACPLWSSVRKVSAITPLALEANPVLDGTIRASYFERRRSFPLQPSVPRMSPTAQAAAKKPSQVATSAIEDDHLLSDAGDADDEGDRRGRGRSRDQRSTSVARREISSSDRDRQSSAASSRGESRRRSRRRSPSDSRNRRMTDRIQPDVIPEIEYRGRVPRKVEIPSGLSTPSESEGNINAFPQAQPSQPTVISATQPRILGGHIINLSHLESTLHVPPGTHGPTTVPNTDWVVSGYKSPIVSTGKRTPPIPRSGSKQKTTSQISAREASEYGGNASGGNVKGRMNDQDSRAARALQRLFEEGLPV